MQSLGIVIPAHNEEKRIKPTLEAYSRYFDKLRKSKKLNYEILVIINASKDSTIDIVKKAKKQNSRIVYLDLIKGGKGYAVIEGFKFALARKHDLIGFVDADMATSPDAFYDLVKNIGDAGGIIPNRWVRESIIKTKQTILRRITSRVFNFIVRALFLMPYTDTQCGAKLFSRKAMESTVNEIGNTRFAFDVELLYKVRRNGFEIKEIPTIWEDKTDTSLNLIKTPFEMFTGVLRLRLMNSPFKFAIRAYDALPEKLKFHHKLF